MNEAHEDDIDDTGHLAPREARATGFYPPSQPYAHVRARDGASTHDDGYVYPDVVAGDRPDMMARASHAIAEESDSLRVLAEDYREVGTLAQLTQLYAALPRAKATFEPIRRSKDVWIESQKGSYGFSYAPLEDVIRACEPSLNREGLTISFFPSVGAENAKIRAVLSHSGGGRIQSITEFMKPSDIKQYGGNLTYQKRYIYCSILNVAADADADDMPVAERGEMSARAPEPRTPAEEQANKDHAARAYKTLQDSRAETPQRPAARPSARQDADRPSEAQMKALREQQERLGHIGPGKNSAATLAHLASQVVFGPDNRPKRMTELTAADTDKLINHMKTLKAQG